MIAAVSYQTFMAIVAFIHTHRKLNSLGLILSFVSQVEMKETKLAVALRPILVTIYCCGFNLSELQSFKTGQRIYSTVCFSLNSAISLYLFYVDISGLSEWTVEIIIGLITQFNFNVISFFMMNTTLYILSWNGMKDFWKTVHQFEEMNYFNRRFYRMIRRQSWFAVIFTLTMVSGAIILC